MKQRGDPMSFGERLVTSAKQAVAIELRVTKPLPLTKPQARTLAFVKAAGDKGVTPRELARLMWPDSVGWAKRSRRGSTHAGGALGATMPMKGAVLLHRLLRLRLVYHNEYDRWCAR